MSPLIPRKRDCREAFIRALSWKDTPPYSLLCYVLGKHVDESIIENLKADWPSDTEFSYFPLDDDWAFEAAVIDIDTSEVTDEIDLRIARTLSRIAESKGTICWFMFEGKFCDYHDLFKPDQQRSIYGICLPEGKPLVCTIDAERDKEKLFGLVAAARSWLVSTYPQVFQCP